MSQSFLVGDHREYNTLLVWPNPKVVDRARAAEALTELLSSLVASANRFLAPFERVVAFQLLPRALDLEHGELTHKASFKREAIEKNWKELIDRMYEKRHLALPVDGRFLRIPNWVLRELSVLQHEVSLQGNELKAGERALRVEADPAAPGALRVGDLAYASDGSVVDLGALLSRPALWVGNDPLRRFLGEEAFQSLVARKRKGGGGDLRLDPRLWCPPAAERIPPLLEAVDQGEVTFASIHAAGELLRAERPEARRAISHLHIGMAVAQSDQAILCRALLRRAADAPDDDVRRRAFRVLLANEEPSETLATLRLFLDRLGAIALRDEDLADLGDRGLTDAQVQVLLAHLTSARADVTPADPSERRLLIGVMRLLTACAISHPVYFARVRVPLARLALHDDAALAARAGEEMDRLRRGFSNWVGPNLRLAIDPQTGAEYGWKDVLVFDEAIPAEARTHLLQALEDNTIVRASVFLLGRGVLLSLGDIPPGGASVSLLGREHGKAVYRLSVHTRAREVFDLAINVAEEMNYATLRQEVSWLLAAGAPPPLVEQFGGYFAEWGIFTEEFISGENVERQVARLLRQGEAARLRSLWPFLVWSAAELHVRFWDRSHRRLALREPSPSAFIVPSHDYQSGARLVSVSDRSACSTLDEVLDRFQRAFMDRAQAVRPELAAEADDRVLLAATVEAVGHDRGLALLEEAAPTSRRALAMQGMHRPAPRDRLHAAAGLVRGPPLPPLAGGQPAGHGRGPGQDAGGALGHLPAGRGGGGLARHPGPLLPPDRLRGGAHGAGGGPRPAGAPGPRPPGGGVRPGPGGPGGGGPRRRPPDRDRGLLPGPDDLPVPGPDRRGGAHLHALRRPLRHRGGGCAGRRGRRALHRPRAGLASGGGPAAPPLPRVQPAGQLLRRARVPALPRPARRRHRRPLLPAGRAGAGPDGEDHGRPPPPRQGGLGRPDAGLHPAPEGPRG